MEVERQLFWHQGLFLQPQHFQVLERSVLSLLAPYQQFFMPHFWGVVDMDVEKAALGTRSFSLMTGEFLFPDGTHAVLSRNAVVEARSFEEGWVEGEKPFTVYVALKKWNPLGENVTVVENLTNISSVTTRFVSLAEPEEIRDLHSGGPAGQIKRLYQVLKICWETEKDHLGDFVYIPVAQLERMGEEVRLSEQFIPPLVLLSASGALMRIVKEIRDQIAARGRQLEEMKSRRGIQTAEFGSRDMVYLLALRSINRYVPLLYHLTEVQRVHSWTVYGLLRQLIGELSSFSEKVDVMGRMESEDIVLPSYDHENMKECFFTAQTLVTKLLDEITAGPEYIIRLIFDGTYYGAELKPAIFEGRNRFFLVFRTEADPKIVLQSIAAYAKLSSREHLPILIARALPGIDLEHLPVPPQELPRRAHTVYCAVDHHNDQWIQVRKTHNVALYWDNAPDDLEVELMVVGRR